MINTGINKLLSASLGFIALLTSLCQAIEELKPLAEYPTATKIWLTMEDGRIQPANKTNYRTNSETYISFLKPNGSTLKKDDTWGILDKKQLDIEERSISIEKRKLKLARRESETKHQEYTEKLRLDLETLTTKIREIEKTLENDDLSPKLKERVKKALQTLDKKVIFFEERLEPQELEDNLATELKELDLAHDRKLRSFEKIKRRSILKAEFDGTLTIFIAEPDTAHLKKDAHWISTSKLYATITDETHYELLLSNRNPIFNTEDRKLLIALVDDGTSHKLIQATYHELRKVETSGAIRDNHIFRIPQDSNSFAAQNVGENKTLYIYKKLKKPCHIISKKRIALIAPAILEKGGWDALVRYLFPGSKLVHIGPTTLAIEASNEN